MNQISKTASRGFAVSWPAWARTAAVTLVTGVAWQRDTFADVEAPYIVDDTDSRDEDFDTVRDRFCPVRYRMMGAYVKRSPSRTELNERQVPVVTACGHQRSELPRRQLRRRTS